MGHHGSLRLRHCFSVRGLQLFLPLPFIWTNWIGWLDRLRPRLRRWSWMLLPSPPPVQLRLDRRGGQYPDGLFRGRMI